MRIPDFTPEQRRGLLVIAIGAVILTIFFFLSSQTEAVPLLQDKSSPSANPSSQSSPPSKRVIYVDVAGKVRVPGVYQLPEGSRVIDAITIAGGLKLGVTTTHINLARILIDGEQVLILKEKYVAAPSSSGRRSIFTGKVSINSGTKAQFDSLPGIGPVIAQRIIDFRGKNGPFSTVESIKSVAGIGDAIFGQISQRLTL